jgi:hypothetical protein
MLFRSRNIVFGGVGYRDKATVYIGPALIDF